MDEKDFSELGLTRNESRVYLVLIEFGKLGASEVSSKSGVSYSRIYDILESLVVKGVVQIVPERTKKYIAGNPDDLLSMVSKKEESLKKIREGVKKLKKVYDNKEKNPVLVGFGKKAFYKIANETSRPKTWNYMVQYNSEYRPDWDREMRVKLRKKMDVKILSRVDSETKENIEKWNKVYKKGEMKKVVNRGIVLGMGDGGNDVLIGLLKSNSTVLIRDKAFSDLMKRFFLAYYEKAEKID